MSRNLFSIEVDRKVRIALVPPPPFYAGWFREIRKAIKAATTALRKGQSVSGLWERKKKKKEACVVLGEIPLIALFERGNLAKKSRLRSCSIRACATWTRVLNESGNRRLSNTILMAIHAKRNYPFHSIWTCDSHREREQQITRRIGCLPFQRTNLRPAFLYIGRSTIPRPLFKIITSREKLNLETSVSSFFLFLFPLDTLRIKLSLSFKIIISIEKVNLSPMSTLPFFLFDIPTIIELSLPFKIFVLGKS